MSDTGTTRIEFVDGGFDLVASGRRDEVRWEHVREIVAYRREPGGADLMCLGFRVTATDAYVEVCETADGYAELLPRMYEQFPRIDQEWWKPIALGLGSNRTTIHGMELASQLQQDPNQQFLLAVADPQRRRRRWKRRLTRLALIAAAVLIVALLQQWLAALVEHNPDARWDDLLAIAAGPLVLSVLVARGWPKPKVFFILLGGFYLAEAFLLLLCGGPIGPSLIDRLLGGKLQYVLFIGLDILAAMGVMLLPDPRATAPRKR